MHVFICQWRCSPEWTSVPCYKALLLDDSTDTQPPCLYEKNDPSNEKPDFHRRGLINGLYNISSRQSTESALTVENSSTDYLAMGRGESLYFMNTQFERLVSGQESELGEAPPAYDVIGRSHAVR
jgi:hypothetical protein